MGVALIRQTDDTRSIVFVLGRCFVNVLDQVQTLELGHDVVAKGGGVGIIISTASRGNLGPGMGLVVAGQNVKDFHVRSAGEEGVFEVGLDVL